ncbi:MAG TPA: sulfotransferase [Rubrobacter sp.]|nr:sulfotransferase [Rubrobacter sp.]
MKLIGAGFGRTGTTSLKAALERLGLDPCYHMTEVFAHPDHADFWVRAWHGKPVDWDGVIGGYEATVDWPACTFYETLMERYPEAKVLLSVRDPERWYESTRGTIYELTRLTEGSTISRLIFGVVGLLVFGGFTGRRSSLANDLIWEGTFDGKFEDRAYAMGVFERHNEEVKRRVPRDRLLVYEVSEGWGPLCEFLCVPVPDEPFPRLNDTAQMKRGMRAIKALSVALPAALALTVAAALVLLLRRAGDQSSG